MAEILNNIALFGEGIIHFAKLTVIHAGGAAAGFALLIGGFKFLRKR